MKNFATLAFLVTLAASAFAQTMAQCTSMTVCDGCRNTAQPGAGGGACGWCPSSPGATTGVCTLSRDATCPDPLNQFNLGTRPCPGSSAGTTTSSSGGGNGPCDPAAHANCGMPSTICADGVVPVAGPAPGCCASCRFACSTVNPNCARYPACTQGVVPIVNTTDCCLTCRPGPPCADFTAVPDCANGAHPVPQSNGCPSCKIPPGTNCANANCNFASIPECTADQQPLPSNANPCCPTCRMRPCDPSLCAANYENIRLCAAGENPVFVPSNCCPSCRQSQSGFTAGGTCTTALVRSCIDDAEVCDSGQVGVFDPTVRCCASCTRPASNCPMTAAGQCFKNARVCDRASGEVPVFQDNSCCPTCVPSAPTCTPACSASQICTPSGRDKSGAPTFACRNVDSVTFTFTVVDSVTNDQVAQLDSSSLNGVFFELVARYCEEAAAAERCAKHMDAVLRSTCRITAGQGTRTVTLACNIPKPATTTRAVATDSPAGLASDSTAATNNDQFKVKSNGGSTSAAAAVQPLAALAAAAAALLVFVAAL